MLTAYDPVTGAGARFNRGGVIKLSTTTGRRTVEGFELYDSGSDPLTFGKGQGLGDLELVCDKPQIEIGNIVWSDTDEDGIQDPEEPAIEGVEVQLYLSLIHI